MDHNLVAMPIDLRVCSSLTFLFNLFKDKKEFIWHVPFRLLGLSLKEWSEGVPGKEKARDTL
jgi:hypothetical protein